MTTKQRVGHTEEPFCECHFTGEFCRLHAAAPELLEACKKAEILIESLNDGGMGSLVNKNGLDVYLQLQEAIAKATGESHA